MKMKILNKVIVIIIKKGVIIEISFKGRYNK